MRGVVDRGSDTNRAATSPIAILLIVALTLVVAGAGFVFLGDVVDIGETTPQARMTADYDADRGLVRIQHDGGDTLTRANTESLTVRVRDASDGSTEEFEWLSGTTSRISAGDGFVLDDAGGLPVGDAAFSGRFEPGDRVQVVWQTDEQSTILAAYTVDQAARPYLGWTLEPRRGLLAHFPLDERDLVAEDSVGNGDGELMGATPGASGQVGTAYSFDDANDEYVALGRSFDTDGALPQVSACAWFNTDESGTGNFDNWALLDFDRSEYFNLYVRGDDGRVGFSTSAEPGTGSLHDQYSTGSYNDGSWHLACGVYDRSSNEKRLYVDGTLESTVSDPHDGKALGSGATRYGFIGDGSEATSFDGSRNGFHYDGRIDDVRLYDEALSAGEVQDLYDAGTGGSATAPTSGLVNHWRLDERDTGDGDTVLGERADGSTVVAENNGAFGNASGVDGTAFEFRDGGYVAIDDSFDTAGELPQMTACSWFRTSESGGGEFDNWALLDYDRSEYFNLYVRGDTGGVGFSTSSQGNSMADLSTTGTDFADGSWHFACGVYDGSEKRIYVDGSLEASANQHGGAPLGTGTPRFGFIGDGSEAGSFDGDRNDEYYDGRVDEVRLYDRALDQAEIEALYTADGGGSGNRTVTTEARSYPATFDADELVLTNVDATVPSGTSITVTVESDPDGDGTFEESSAPIALSGATGSVDVTGLGTDSDTFRLRIELGTTTGTLPTFGGAELTTGNATATAAALPGVA
ncbi:LamG-like jellyroll fold domain-containing protein [Haloarchaeobius baliensis]|uniref:LamG-like jellyroll fold domain-containing protein n=1 Tax=Haloarchaeobius baliensis TaxID=1670458 RepID=UPI003F881973